MQIDSNNRFGSYEHFNRVLYGGHANDADQARFFTFAGDTPIFMGATSDYTKDTWCYQAKNGVLLSGLLMTPGHVEPGSHDLFSQWFHESADVAVTWHHGYLSYELTQLSPWCSAIRAKIEVYPLQQDDGFFVHYDLTTDQRMLFCAGFGGITPFFGRFEYHCSPGREFCKEDCRGNTATVENNRGFISGPKGVTMLIGSDFEAEYSTDSAEALLEKYPSMFLTPHENRPEIIKISRELLPKQRWEGNLIVLRNSTPEILNRYLAQKNLCRKLRGEIRAKYAGITFETPDPVLNDSVRDTMIALDASFHGRTFYHGAVGYHAPFLGWRGWYAPVLLGAEQRVKTAILNHFDTITQSNGKEKVWWDGGPRPDLDHEGTQYHHLQNSPGHLTALLHRDDIYDMQEVAVDMTLYYIEVTGDLKTADAVFDRLCQILDWEERILAPEGDGLYQNFLNTWISDGHSYNGAKCAQATSYNYSANLRAARIGKQLGRDVSRLEARAEKIQQAFHQHFWQPNTGIVAESIDTLGNRLVHAMPELSTIYLASDCGNLSFLENYRQLRYAEKSIPQETTRLTRGKLFYSSNWQPKKYSTCGLFPAENAALALCYFQNGQSKKAHEILRALEDAFQLSPYFGSLTHVLSAQGGTDDGDIDFTDVSSTYLRTLIEGLWGVRWDRIQGKLALRPQLPEDWNSANLELEHLTLRLSRTHLQDHYGILSDTPCTKEVLLPLRKAKADQIFLNGKPVEFEQIPQIEYCCARFSFTETRADIKIFYQDIPYPSLPTTAISAYPGNRLDLQVNNGEILSLSDWDGIFASLQESPLQVTGAPGKHDLLILATNGETSCYLPLEIQIPDTKELRPLPKNLSSREICLAPYFNASLTTIHQQEFRSPRPSCYSIGMRLNGRYAWEWNHFGHNALVIDDSRLRQAGGKITSSSGIPFLTPEQGNNAVTVSLWDNYPSRTVIPIEGKGEELALLLCGTTHAMQSGVVNARIIVEYRNGKQEIAEMIPPFNFDDFLLGAFQTQNETLYFSDGTHGMIQKIRLNPAWELKSLTLEAVANEVIFNCLAATLRFAPA